jgi:hypothetical protein
MGTHGACVIGKYPQRCCGKSRSLCSTAQGCGRDPFGSFITPTIGDVRRLRIVVDHVHDR